MVQIHFIYIYYVQLPRLVKKTVIILCS